MNKLYDVEYKGVTVSIELSNQGKYHAFFDINGETRKTECCSEEDIIIRVHKMIDKIINPKKKINPLYKELAKIAYDTVLRTMQEGEKTHSQDEWKKQTVEDHQEHALNHISSSIFINETEDHIAHALTRCTMIKYLETR